MKRPTVTVAISAFNEEANIANFLNSVLAQKEENFILRDIWVLSDGSTDKTVEIAGAIGSPKIRTFNDKERIGKSSRLNKIYGMLKSDILVQSDADVIFANPFTIRNLIAPLLDDKKIKMTGGYCEPLPGRTFTERADEIAYKIYQPMVSELRGQSNPFSANGGLLAYRKELVKQIKIPQDMTSNDIYTYFCCISLGHHYQYVRGAVVRVRCPSTLEDKLKQNKRSAAIQLRLARYFDTELIKKEFEIPYWLRLKSIARQLLRAPIKCTYIFFINVYCNFKAAESNRILNAKWPMAWTTKKL